MTSLMRGRLLLWSLVVVTALPLALVWAAGDELVVQVLTSATSPPSAAAPRITSSTAPVARDATGAPARPARPRTTSARTTTPVPATGAPVGGRRPAAAAAAPAAGPSSRPSDSSLAAALPAFVPPGPPARPPYPWESSWWWYSYGPVSQLGCLPRYGPVNHPPITVTTTATTATISWWHNGDAATRAYWFGWRPESGTTADLATPTQWLRAAPPSGCQAVTATLSSLRPGTIYRLSMEMEALTPETVTGVSRVGLNATGFTTRTG